MNLHSISTFVIASLVLFITPGPNLIMVLGRGISQGRQAAIMAVIGFAVGDVIHTALIVVGISIVIESSIVLFQIVKYFGSLYLIYLGVETVFNKQQFRSISRHRCVKLGSVLYQSIISSVLNPSTILFFLVFFPHFIEPEAGSLKIQTLILGVIFVALGILTYLPIAYFSAIFGKWLCINQLVARKVNWITGSVFISLGIWAMLSAKAANTLI